jgi:hypothetical protein
MPFAFSTSALRLRELYSTLRPKSEAQDGAMLHEARINFWRKIVNQTQRSFCRAAAQFNETAAPNRRRRFTFPAWLRFDHWFRAQRPLPAAVGEPRRWAKASQV